MCKTTNINIGTSGWSYPHWTGDFYPTDIAESEYLKFYMQKFCTVEINNSFYRLPLEKTIINWVKTVPHDFVFSIKASRYITHMKKLTGPEQSTSLFFERIASFGDKAGPILFQLPPRFSVNTDRLGKFLDILPTGYLYAMEFRDHSWFNQEVYELLKQKNIAFCIYYMGDYTSPKVITGDFVYIRYHGPVNLGQGFYNNNEINSFASEIKEFLQSGKQVYCYFNNDQAGYAIKNAFMLKTLLEVK